VNSTAAPIPFARSMLRQHRHVCAFFSSPEAEYDTLLPFIRDGINCGSAPSMSCRPGTNKTISGACAMPALMWSDANNPPARAGVA
jgi:hypothetical protein